MYAHGAINALHCIAHPHQPLQSVRWIRTHTDVHMHPQKQKTARGEERANNRKYAHTHVRTLAYVCVQRTSNNRKYCKLRFTCATAHNPHNNHTHRYICIAAHALIDAHTHTCLGTHGPLLGMHAPSHEQSSMASLRRAMHAEGGIMHAKGAIARLHHLARSHRQLFAPVHESRVSCSWPAHQHRQLLTPVHTSALHAH